MGETWLLSIVPSVTQVVTISYICFVGIPRTFSKATIENGGCERKIHRVSVLNVQVLGVAVSNSTETNTKINYLP